MIYREHFFPAVLLYPYPDESYVRINKNVFTQKIANLHQTDQQEKDSHS
jgi:hypothetical protein